MFLHKETCHFRFYSLAGTFETSLSWVWDVGLGELWRGHVLYTAMGVFFSRLLNRASFSLSFGHNTQASHSVLSRRAHLHGGCYPRGRGVDGGWGG